MFSTKVLKAVPFLILTTLNLAISAAHADNGGTSGGGGDAVEPLFFKAQADAVQLIDRIKPEAIEKLQIDETFKNWLRDGSRLINLQFYTRAMELVFQEGPCFEDSNPRGACFDDSIANHPRMIISRSYNRMTTPEQAEALVLHEAGHFTGEMDHLFLSQFGAKLVMQRNLKPRHYKGRATERSLGQDQQQAMHGDEVEEVACRIAAESAGKLALHKCREAGNTSCIVISTIEISKESREPIFARTWGKCTVEALASSQ